MDQFNAIRSAHAAPVHGKLAHNEVDPTRLYTMLPRNARVAEELLRNGDIVSVELIGNEYIYKTADGLMFTSHIPPKHVQYPYGH